MDIKKFIEPSSEILASNPGTIALLPLSFILFLFYRVLLLWGYHNLFHMTYLLIICTLFQVNFVSTHIGRSMNERPISEHSRIRNSSIVIGYIWSLMLYTILSVMWAIDLWQVQLGVDWPVSTYVPDIPSLMLIISFCGVHLILTVVSLFWQWDSFTKSGTDNALLVLDEKRFQIRGTIILSIFLFEMIILLTFKASIEGESHLLSQIPWVNHFVIGVVTLVVVTILTIVLLLNHLSDRFANHDVLS